MVGRALLAVLLCATTGGALWAVSAVAGPGQAMPSAARSSVATLGAPLPQVSQLQLRAVPMNAAGKASNDAHEKRPAAVPTQDPLARWAADTAPLVGVGERELISYGAADLAMQQSAPACHLSWMTLAAIGRVGSEQVRTQAGVPAVRATAESLCAGGRDTATEAGWVSAVGATGDGTAHVHRVLAAATAYATAVGSGTPLSPSARAAIDFAIDQIGLPYVWGGNGPRQGDAGFDCSGLTTAAYAAAGVGLPRTAHTQFFATRHLAAESVQPGDLVFYGSPSTKIHHVGLYIGNGQMINAPTFGMPVQVAPVRSSGDSYAGAGRPAG